MMFKWTFNFFTMAGSLAPSRVALYWSTSPGRGLRALEPKEGQSQMDAEPKLRCWCSWREKGSIVVHPTSSSEPLWTFSTVGCCAFLPAVRHEWELQWRKRREKKNKMEVFGRTEREFLCVLQPCVFKEITHLLANQTQTSLCLPLFGENESVKGCVLMTLL